MKGKSIIFKKIESKEHIKLVSQKLGNHKVLAKYNVEYKSYTKVV